MATTKKETTKKKTTAAKKSATPKIKKVELTKLNKIERKKEVENEKGTNFVITVLGIIVLVIVAILIFGLTYAYFTATIKDTTPDKKIAEIQTANLLVRYLDGSSNVELGDKIEPGDILTKDFSVINEGNDTGMYAIALENIEHLLGHEEENEFISDVEYNLVKLDTINNNEVETIIATGILPFKSGKNENAFILYTKDSVQYQGTNKYRLKLTYINHLNIDQSDSMGESLKLKVNIIESVEENRTQDTEY